MSSDAPALTTFRGGDHRGAVRFEVDAPAPRSNPDGYSINLRCIDGYPDLPFTVESFDGRNWETAGEALRNLSKEEKQP